MDRSMPENPDDQSDNDDEEEDDEVCIQKRSFF